MPDDRAKSDARRDATLVAAANAGDETAFEALYVRYRDWVARLAFRFTGNHDDALDVLQDTFAYLAGKFPGFTLTARMTTFLYPVVRNIALAAKRKRRLPLPAVDAEVMAPAPNPLAASRTELATVMNTLPAAQREVVLMRFVDDLSLAEIAQALRIPLGTVKSRLHHALAALRTDPRTRRYFLD